MKFILILVAFFSFGSTFAANPESNKEIAVKKTGVKVTASLPSTDITENLDNPLKENSEISGLMQELHGRVVGEESKTEADSVR